jgi:hypothetical protein
MVAVHARCGCVCQAVRAPGAKWTTAAPMREASEGDASVSMYTSPVNQSTGPLAVSAVALVICISLLPPLRGSLNARAVATNVQGVSMLFPQSLTAAPAGAKERAAV